MVLAFDNPRNPRRRSYVSLPTPFGYWPIIDGNVFQDTPGTVAAANTDLIREIGNDGSGGGAAISPSDSARGTRDGAKVTCDGSDDSYVTSIDIDNGDSFTMAVKYTPNELGRRQIIMGRGKDTDGGWSINLEQVSDDTYKCWLVLTSPGVDVPVVVGTTLAEVGVERHVCAVWNAGVNLKLYIDGVLEATTAMTNTVLRTSGIGLRIADTDGAPSILPNGKVSEPRVYKVALDAAQVALMASL